MLCVAVKGGSISKRSRKPVGETGVFRMHYASLNVTRKKRKFNNNQIKSFHTKRVRFASIF